MRSTARHRRLILLRSRRGARPPSRLLPLLPVLLTLATVSPPEAQAEYRMLVNVGGGWKDSDDFDSLESCKREAAAFAKKYAVQAGCALKSTLDRWRADERYRQLALECARQNEVEIVRKPGRYFTVFGPTQNRSAFETCMSESPDPTR